MKLLDENLAEMVKDRKCEDSLKELIRRHSNIFYKICQKYAPAMKKSGLSPDDVFDEKDYVIYRSATSYNPSKKTKFSTWLGNCSKYLCLNFINKKKRSVSFEDEGVLQFVMDKADDSVEIKSREDDLAFIFSILDKLKDKRIKRVFQLRYLEGKKQTWNKVSKGLNVSTQTAINLHAKGIRVLNKKILSTDYSDTI